MTKRNKFLQVAIAEIGSKEPTGDDKYIKWYNKKCGTNFAMNVSWCCIFVSWCAEQAGIAKIVKPFASCTAMTNWFKNQGLFKERGKYTPKPGDIIMYDWDKSGDSDHVGIVEKKVGDKITVIEGNYNDAVKRREVYLSNVLIRGYCIPKFPSEGVNGVGEDSSNNSTSKPTLQKGSKGDCVKTLQTRLNKMRELLKLDFAKLDVDGDFGNNTLSAVKAFQSARKLTVDGIVGKNTWEAISINYGDVNGDGKVNVLDSQVVLKSSVGKTKLTSAQNKAADMNADGKVNAADSQIILKRSVGK